MSKDRPAHELDDGATEVVSGTPATRPQPVSSLADTVKVPPGGRMEAMRAAGKVHRQDFILTRTPRGLSRISVPHIEFYKALWQVWARKRTEGDSDPGVTVAEVVEQSGKDPAQVTHVLGILRKNQVIRSVVTHIGWGGTRAKYYPTEASIDLLSFSEWLGRDSFVQVGRTLKSWQRKRFSEPPDIFQYAFNLSGGLVNNRLDQP